MALLGTKDTASRRVFPRARRGALLVSAVARENGVYQPAPADPECVPMKDAGAKLVWSPQSNLRLSTHVDADHVTRLEPLLAWGKQMLLDTSYAVRPGQDPPPTLAQLRQSLIAKYPQVGSIFA
jgi:hypothetical protein